MSMFRSAADISSSDSSSDESDSSRPTSRSRHADERNSDAGGGGATSASQASQHNSQGATTEATALPEHNAVLDRDAENHASMMTAALLEFYCLSRAADVLNSQKGSHGKFTRDSPEVQYLGRRMYAYKSQFLSSHGLLATGIERQEWSTTRQYYRDNLDLLGMTALEELNLDAADGRPPPIRATSDLELVPKAAASKHFGRGSERPERVTPGMRGGPWNPSKRLPSSENVKALQNIQLDMGNLLAPALPLLSSSPASFPLTGPQPSHHSSHHVSRYAAEFAEIKVLGRGSFGEVYHVRNHIDGQNYAVKKIPLSHRRLEQLQGGGQHHLETIMKEIRTLARLEHTNIVRYYGAWIEQVQHMPYVTLPDLARHEPEIERRSAMGSPTSSVEQDPLEDQSFGIVFEHSETSDPDGDVSTVSVGSSSRSVDKQRRRQSHSTMGSSFRSKKSLGRSLEDDDEVESIPRPFSIPSPGVMSTIGASDDIFTDGLSQDHSDKQIQTRQGVRSEAPAVVLHIQMSLHPISLHSYLTSQRHVGQTGSGPSPRRHCFHLIPALKLMLAIISGVEYLHSKGIVHRDLKPANIFLSPSETCHRHPCPVCHPDVAASGHFCHPRIGDFGLVADVSHLNDASSPEAACSAHSDGEDHYHINRVVGTEFYRPPLSSGPDTPNESDGKDREQRQYATDEKIDVYALGVILFELIYRLSTRMERQLVMSRLTRGDHTAAASSTGWATVPSDFAQKIDLGQMQLEDGGCVADRLMTCFRGMLHPDPVARWTCRDVRESLTHLLAVTEKVYAGCVSHG